jgi:DNA-binding LytR/AlgR family response regulator
MPKPMPTHKPFFVWQNRKLIRLFPEDVVGLRIDENYTKLYINEEGPITIRSTMTSALEKLPEDMFIRVHKKFAVSILYIESIANDHLIIGKEAIPIGRQYKKALIWKLNIIE